MSETCTARLKVLAPPCRVCDDAGFIRAAPVGHIRFRSVSDLVAGAAWDSAVTVPCWVCGGGRR